MDTHFISITDLNPLQIRSVLDLSEELKRELSADGANRELLKGRTMLMFFEKPSLRTRISFEIGMTQLGGHAIYLTPADVGLGSRERISDVARVSSSMADILMARVFKHEVVTELAAHSAAPVINGLSDLEHPCQILADLLTIREKKGDLSGLKLSFVGDGENNVTHSLCLASAMLGMRFACASPHNLTMNKEIVKKARSLACADAIMETHDPVEAVADADIVYTDTWVSMGDEKERTTREQLLRPYQVTKSLMKKAKPEAIFMHDMPAYRGLEVEVEVIDGIQSVVFEQAENRLHAQKGLVGYLLGCKR
ncbi:ornithine carbamoyltransferase [Candidatus Roizmanbacteria bacterium]|nr:ornithine carbamoyltransferase [Candidatus Roizmanbacteria bacterium]